MELWSFEESGTIKYMKFSLTLSSSLFIVLATLTAALYAPQVHAGECFSHPVQEMDASATITSGVFVRTVACMEGSEVVATLSAGESVAVHAYDDGWYEISRADGTRGWIWEDFLSVSTEPFENQEEEKQETGSAVTDGSLVGRMKGRILLQVEDHGEAYYVHPDSGDRYYMKDGPTAYEMMRAFGLGITNADLAGIPEVDSEEEMLNASSVCSYNSLAAGLKGRILLQVEELGEAYYVHPDTCRRIYMKDGASAYEIMRYLSLGISNSDLAGIPERIFEAVPYAEKETDKQEAGDDKQEAEYSEEQHVSALQEGEIPSKVDVLALNEYWLEEVNALRAQHGLRQLVLDQRWIDTATEYAALMHENQWYAHERDGGLSMHDWIDTKGLEFTERYSDDGWASNYFTENISWGITDNSTEGVEWVLDYSKDFFLSEIDWNGPHYRTIYHEDWNSVGLGFYFEPQGSDSYKVYIVMHYGSLEM